MLTKLLSKGWNSQQQDSRADINTEIRAKLERDIARVHAAEHFGNELNALVKKASLAVSSKHLLPHRDDHRGKYEEVVRIIEMLGKSLLSALIIEDNSLLDDYMAGFQEMLTAIDHSASWYVEALECIKANHSLEGHAKLKLDRAIDYLIEELEYTNEAV